MFSFLSAGIASFGRWLYLRTRRAGALTYLKPVERYIEQPQLGDQVVPFVAQSQYSRRHGLGYAPGYPHENGVSCETCGNEGILR
jgi:hypothetical protein